MTATPFSSTLATLRASRRISQSRLAEAAGVQHSFVSRLESGSRSPSRNTVVALADALGATDSERANLLGAAGFASQTPIHDPTVAELHDVLHDASVPVAARDALRALVGGALTLARGMGA